MACPICKKDATPQFRPFCSKRCADIDLGRWMTGKYTFASQREEDHDEALDALEAEDPQTH